MPASRTRAVVAVFALVDRHRQPLAQGHLGLGVVGVREPGAGIVHDPRVVWNTRDIVARDGGRAIQSKTGHAFVKAVMRETGLLGEVLKLSDFEQLEQTGYLDQLYKRLKRFESQEDDRSLKYFLEEFEHERLAGEAGGLPARPGRPGRRARPPPRR